MTPRTMMVGLQADSSLNEVMETTMHQRHSRYPVFTVDQDHIVGFLHIKDLARYLVEGDQPFALKSLMRPASFVPSTVTLDDVLTRFRAEHFQVAVVIGEYGGTAGIVTLEDLAEELIGEIQDEFDSEVAPIYEIEPGVLRVRGDLQLAELTQHYGYDFPDINAETVGGLIMERLSRVAKVGDIVEQSGLLLTVEEMDDLAINAVRVQLPTQG